MYRLLEIKPRLSLPLFVVLVFCAASWINSNYIAGGILVILFMGILFLTSGFIIDKDNNRIRKVVYFLGFRFGKWHTMPEIKYISLLRVRLARKSYSPSSRQYVQRTSKNYTYRVNLIIHGDRQKPFRLISTTREKAIEEGLKLGEYLGLKVFDSTTPDRKWIK
jgi:hypothetical protein